MEPWVNEYMDSEVWAFEEEPVEEYPTGACKMLLRRQGQRDE